MEKNEHQYICMELNIKGNDSRNLSNNAWL